MPDRTLAQDLTLFHRGHYLCAQKGDATFSPVKPVWAAPLSHPDKYLALLNESGEEIAMLPDVGTLSKDSRAAVEEELRRRYLTTRITRVVAVEPQHGPVYFTVETDRGQTTFLVEHLQDNAVWFSDTHGLLIDTNSNRFEIPDMGRLDAKSRALLRTVL